MSWQGKCSFANLARIYLTIFTAYVDSNLVGSGKVTKAAIIGQKGGVWASTPGYTVSL